MLSHLSQSGTWKFGCDNINWIWIGQVWVMMTWSFLALHANQIWRRNLLSWLRCRTNTVHVWIWRCELCKLLCIRSIWEHIILLVYDLVPLNLLIKVLIHLISLLWYLICILGSDKLLVDLGLHLRELLVWKIWIFLRNTLIVIELLLLLLHIQYLLLIKCLLCEFSCVHVLLVLKQLILNHAICRCL